MTFHFKEVVKFALKEDQTVDRALSEFLGGQRPPEDVEEETFSLFTEWLIFNFCTQRTLSFLNEYVLDNPDNLQSSAISELKEIAETQWYGGFEILKVKRGEFLEVEHLFSGRKIRVFDKLGSKNAPSEGTILCRVAKVGKKYYMVGSDPLFLPVSHTLRMKKMMRERKQDFCSSPKESLRMLLSKKEPPKFCSQREILKKRSELKKEYSTLLEKHPFLSPFDDLTGRVYLEKRTKNFLDILETLFKSEEAKEIIINNNRLLQEVWNFYPHKILGGKCPTELLQKNWRSGRVPVNDCPSADGFNGQEEFRPFDNCPICQKMKRAQEMGENLPPADLRKAFQEAKEGGATMGGELPDDPDISLADFQHIVSKIGRNDPCPCGAKKSDGTPLKYKYCHGKGA